jgi:hypothetical protein
MTFSSNTLRRLGTILALTAAIAGVAAPAALANHQDVGVTEALRELRGTAPTSDAVDRYLRNHPQPAASGACDAVCRYLNNHTQGVRFITDTLAPGGGASMQIPASDGAFSWGDASVGAATVVGSLLVLLGGALVVLRKRQRLVL